MQCDSCGRTVATDTDTCGQCGAPVGNGGDVSRRGRPGNAPGRPPLVTDGGQGSPDDEDDPLADRGGGSDDEPDDEYLDAGDIVDEDESGDIVDEDESGDIVDEDEPGDSPAGGQSEGQPGGQPGRQPEGESDQPPAGAAGDQPQDGQPDQPPAGQPTQQGGQPDPGQGGQANQPSAGGQGQPNQTGQPGQQGEASQAGQPGGAPAGAGGQGAPTGQAGAPLGGEGGQGEQYTEEGDLVNELKRYPLKLGSALGAVAFLIPYGLLTLATFWAWEQPPGQDTSVEPGGWEVVDGSASWSELDVSAELFFYIVELGSGGAVVDLFRRSAGVAPPSEVDPSDYPTAEDQLDPLLDLLAFDAIPDVPLLILFVLAPYILFISSRYLARQYTPGESYFEYAFAGATVTIGTTVIALLLGLVFPVTNFAGRFLLAGILIPGAIGAIGGLSIWAFDDHSALVSSLTAWATMVIGIGVAFLLVPIPDLGLPDSASLNLALLDRIVLGLGAYINAAQFNPGSHAMGRLFFLLVMVLTIGAGFVRAWQVRDSVADRMDGARAGASIFLGFLATIALFLWAFPMATVLVDLSLSGSQFGGWFLGIEGEAIDGAAGASVPTIESVTSVESYFRAIFVAGLVFPMTFGAIGGYLAIWYRDR